MAIRNGAIRTVLGLHISKNNKDQHVGVTAHRLCTLQNLTTDQTDVSLIVNGCESTNTRTLLHQTPCQWVWVDKHKNNAAPDSLSVGESTNTRTMPHNKHLRPNVSVWGGWEGRATAAYPNESNRSLKLKTRPSDVGLSEQFPDCTFQNVTRIRPCRCNSSPTLLTSKLNEGPDWCQLNRRQAAPDSLSVGVSRQAHEQCCTRLTVTGCESTSTRTMLHQTHCHWAVSYTHLTLPTRSTV